MSLKKRCLVLVTLLGWGISSTLWSQDRFFTRQGHISFYSHTPVEDIQAINNQVLSIFDVTTGEIEIVLLMKSFAFEKALMQEHFNENYVESHKFPKASFSGKIEDIQSLLEGEITTTPVRGMLTIKDVTQVVTVETRFVFEKDQITLRGKFMITVADYNIKIPAIVRNNIAREVEVTFQLIHQPYQ